MVAYDDAVRDWRMVAERVAGAMDEPAAPFIARAEAEADLAVRPDLRHHALPLPAPVSWFSVLSRRAYGAMRRLVDDPNDIVAGRELDRLMVLFELF